MSNKNEKPAEKTPREQPAKAAPVFSLARLRKDCRELFGVSASTFDGATCKLTGNHTVEGVKNTIKTWLSTPVRPKKGGK